MAIIPIRDVPSEAVQPSGDELILIDNGIAMQKATINDAVTPKATEIADDKIADLNLGTAAQANVEDFATSAQGELADTAVQPERTITAGDGLTGGGDLSADRTISLNSASIASLALADTAVQPSRSIATGTGLTGGGDLSADRTISLDASSIASLALADSAVQPADLEAVRVPAGGLTGQVLVKESNDDNDVGWATVAAATAVSYAPQTLSPTEQSQARANIDALGPEETPDRAFRRGNILGTVSQSSGVPTGAIIERGSNANGEYVRFADGTQICWRNSLPASSPPNVATGNIFRNNGDIWTYPASFVGSVSAGLSGAGANVRWATHSSSGNMSSNISVLMYSASSSDTIGAYYGLYAFGRWF